MVEVKIDSKEAAISFRRCFVAKKKSGHDFEQLHLANSVMLGTKVRTDIVKGIASQFADEGQTSLKPFKIVILGPFRLVLVKC